MARTRMILGLLMCTPLGLMGCEHAPWGNAMALGLSVMLFVGTLQLGRRAQVPAEGGPVPDAMRRAGFSEQAAGAP